MARKAKPVIERIFNKIKLDKGCWIWQGSKSNSGYGQISYNGRTCSVHRTVYELLNEAIKEGNVIIHSCDNRSCCNPEHLSQGTQKANMQDASSKGRMAHRNKKHMLELSNKYKQSMGLL
jgi:hypothetical protein